MDHLAEHQRRGSKAYILCLAFESLCKERQPRMRKVVMLGHAQAMEKPFWDELARKAGVHHPSSTTVEVAIGILAARAQVKPRRRA